MPRSTERISGLAARTLPSSKTPSTLVPRTTTILSSSHGWSWTLFSASPRRVGDRREPEPARLVARREQVAVAADHRRRVEPVQLHRELDHHLVVLALADDVLRVDGVGEASRSAAAAGSRSRSSAASRSTSSRLARPARNASSSPLRTASARRSRVDGEAGQRVRRRVGQLDARRRRRSSARASAGSSSDSREQPLLSRSRAATDVARRPARPSGRHRHRHRPARGRPWLRRCRGPAPAG